jgi:hypothetical protein
MLKYARIPLLFLFIGTLLGVFLRWQFIAATPGVNYSFLLHGHSHIMFLGWIFNALYIAMCYNHIAQGETKFFRILFISLQVLVVGMLIAFPLQGYGFYSILFSTLHTFGAILFIVRFFKKTKAEKSIAVWYARTAMIFFVISAAGPFVLGYLMANGMGQSNWYYFAIYFYLHFQYNGFFLFGIFSLFFDLLKRKEVQFDHEKAKRFGQIVAGMCVPTYLLSVLWAKPGFSFNILSGLAAFIQLAAVVLLINLIVNCLPEIKKSFARSSQYLFSVVLAALFLKFALQLSSAVPQIAQMAYELRPVVIAYLHLVLIGIVSLGLFVWYIEIGFLRHALAVNTIIFFVLSFLGMELSLTASPWWTTLFGPGIISASEAILVFSIALSIGSLMLLVSATGRKLNEHSIGD